MGDTGKQRLKVQIRGGFADRNNIHPVNTSMQYKDFDVRSRITIANQINATYHAIFDKDSEVEWVNAFWRSIVHNVYVQPIDCSSGMSYYESKMLELINANIYNDDYADVLSLVEYIAKLLYQESEKRYKQVDVYNVLNKTFEKEFIEYRFVNGVIAQIISEIEIAQIEEAASLKDNKVDEHINKALFLLSDRDNPDYENSIKESISAVEAMCNEITGKKSTLGDALKLLKKKTTIHSGLEAAFGKLYGYTSDASGIRHAGQIDGPEATFDEAKFMLVACSGFVNYLKGTNSRG